MDDTDSRSAPKVLQYISKPLKYGKRRTKQQLEIRKVLGQEERSDESQRPLVYFVNQLGERLSNNKV